MMQTYLQRTGSSYRWKGLYVYILLNVMSSFINDH